MSIYIVGIIQNHKVQQPPISTRDENEWVGIHQKRETIQLRDRERCVSRVVEELFFLREEITAMIYIDAPYSVTTALRGALPLFQMPTIPKTAQFHLLAVLVAKIRQLDGELNTKDLAREETK